MRHDAQLNLRVVAANQHAAGARYKSLADTPAFCRAHRNVLQIGVVAGQPPRHRHGLGVIGVYTASLRVHQLRQFVGVGGFELGQAAPLQQGGRQGVVKREFFQHFLVGADRAFGSFLHRRQTQTLGRRVKQHLPDLFRAA